MLARWRRCAIAAVLVVTTLAACGGGDDTSVPNGFGTAAVVIRRADGSICNLCTYVARTASEHAKGLMDVTTLGGHDGMIFVYEEAGVRPFWMKHTVMPLTAAWFDDGGAFIAAYDMAPCPPGTTCPTYGPSGAARDVLEVPQGDLAWLGIGDGSVLVSIGGTCEPST